MTRQIGIIADDLTGANDSGVQLAEKGISTSVFFETPTSETTIDRGIVIDTNSRALTRREAVEATKRAAAFIKQARYQQVYKKMDSTLRGHIGAELKAVGDILDPDFIVVAPAYPKLGRTTVNGIHYVKGDKIANTEVSIDPKHPVLESSIPAIIQNEIGEHAEVLTKEMIEASLSDFTLWINRMVEDGIKYIVCDANTQTDLFQAAKKINSLSKDIVWAGSAGLAEVLPEVLEIDQLHDETKKIGLSQVMTVCGSLSQVTQSQIVYAKKQPNIQAVEIDTSAIFNDNWQREQQQYIQQCTNALREEQDVVLFVPSNEEIRREVKQLADQLSLTPNQIGERISSAIGEMVAQIAKRNEQLTGLVLTGGDTAKDTAKHLGGVGINLIKQVEAGIPLGTLIGTDKLYHVVTKAGSFGKLNSIYEAMQVLKGEETK
ncbi:four-carbon acid sugar kinase family protein [Virgibacillus salexigens]|uniref:Four-carbon acid sugar kinase family protein n=1 Tax=Virgibacillus massiliensis TaxID=1462526 RepID=A0A024QGC4_9BACI|nr:MULTISPECIES: four-carbon acid sugar kinase family protein [Virgibacillus]MYL43217.1 hypothetical protein [Virgibacillus massiliensis]CDQ40976.1 hypothetical protein BN990_03325 [Virgibacillus massiliensis]